MALQLNTTSSITDYLKSVGKPSDYNSRLATYNTSGLNNRLGDYTGSATQHIALLKHLNSPSQTGDISAPTSYKNVQTGVSSTGEPIYSSGVGTPPPVYTPPVRSETAPTEPQTGSSGITASEAMSSIPQFPSTDEILSKVLGSPSFQNFQQGKEAQTAFDIGSAAAEKQKLAGEASANTQAFINKMGRRGLFFSGETEGGIQALASSLASSTLGVDRQLANKLLQSDVQTNEKIMSQVEKVVSDAQAGRKEAISALEKVGLTVVGDKVLPTLAAQSQDRAERNAILAVERENRLAQTAEFNQDVTLARLKLSEDAAARAATSLQLSIDRAAGGGSITSGGLTISKDQIGTAAGELNARRGPDGWTDPYVYMQAYRQWTEQGGLPQDFAKSFPPKLYVNPQASSIPGLLPEFLKNKPSNNVLIFSSSAIGEALDSGE